MPFAYDFYSGYLEDFIELIGSRDRSLVLRYQRLKTFVQQTLALNPDVVHGWDDAVEHLIMDPPTKLTSPSLAIAMIGMLSDLGQRRFQILTDERNDQLLDECFEHLNHREFATDLFNSPLNEYTSPVNDFQWGYLDVNQVNLLLDDIYGDKSYTESKTAAIAGRISFMPRADAEKALLEVGIDTQNNISHNIDYLITGSKGTGGAKRDKVNQLKKSGSKIQILDENGFKDLITSPKKPPAHWPASQVENFEQFVRTLRHINAFDLDLFCISYIYDPIVLHEVEQYH